MSGAADCYLAAVLARGIVRAVVLDDGFAWFGFNWAKFLSSVVFRWLAIGVSTAPLFLHSCEVADKLKTRGIVLYCRFTVATG